MGVRLGPEYAKKNERLTELLKEKRQAIISHAVTKGLRNSPSPLSPPIKGGEISSPLAGEGKGEGALKMKYSGIEWIGEIPEGWEVIKVQYLLNAVSGNGFPEHLQGKTDGEFPFFKVSDINSDDMFVLTSNNYVSRQDVLENSWKIIPSGSILFPKIGEALKKNHRKINQTDCLIDNNMMAIYPKKIRNILGDYLYFLFRSIDMEWFVNPGAVPSVDNTEFKLSFIPIPPILEQTAIANFLDQETDKINEAIKKIQSQIATLKEYRQTLISNVVTGKVRVED